MSYTTRKPIFCRVPNDQIRPLIDTLVAQHGSHALTATYLAGNHGKSEEAWLGIIKRIRSGAGVDPNTAELLSMAADIDLPPMPYKQVVYRVTGYHKTGAPAGYSIRNWYYTTAAKARTKVKKLKSLGTFLEFAKTEATWKILNQ